MHVDKNRNDLLYIFVACSFPFLLTKEQEQQKTRHCLMTHKKENMQRQNLYLKVPEMSANKVGIVANLNLHNLPHRSAFFFNSSRLVETQRESANAEEKSVSLSLFLQTLSGWFSGWIEMQFYSERSTATSTWASRFCNRNFAFQNLHAGIKMGSPELKTDQLGSILKD